MNPRGPEREVQPHAESLLHIYFVEVAAVGCVLPHYSMPAVVIGGVVVAMIRSAEQRRSPTAGAYIIDSPPPDISTVLRLPT